MKANKTSVKRNKTKSSVIVHLETAPFSDLLWVSSAEHWAWPEVIDQQREWSNVSSGCDFHSLSRHCVRKDDGNWVPFNMTLPFLFGAGFGWDLDGMRWRPELLVQREEYGVWLQTDLGLLSGWVTWGKDLTFLVFGYTTVRSGTPMKSCEEQANDIRKRLYKWKFLYEY